MLSGSKGNRTVEEVTRDDYIDLFRGELLKISEPFRDYIKDLPWDDPTKIIAIALYYLPMRCRDYLTDINEPRFGGKSFSSINIERVDLEEAKELNGELEVTYWKITTDIGKEEPKIQFLIATDPREKVLEQLLSEEGSNESSDVFSTKVYGETVTDGMPTYEKPSKGYVSPPENNDDKWAVRDYL